MLVSSEAADARTTMLGPDGGAFEPSCIHVTPWREHYGSKLRLCGRVLEKRAGSWHQQEGRTGHM